MSLWPLRAFRLGAGRHSVGCSPDKPMLLLSQLVAREANGHKAVLETGGSISMNRSIRKQKYDQRFTEER